MTVGVGGNNRRESGRGGGLQRGKGRAKATRENGKRSARCSYVCQADRVCEENGYLCGCVEARTRQSVREEEIRGNRRGNVGSSRRARASRCALHRLRGGPVCKRVSEWVEAEGEAEAEHTLLRSNASSRHVDSFGHEWSAARTTASAQELVEESETATHPPPACASSKTTPSTTDNPLQSSPRPENTYPCCSA